MEMKVICEEADKFDEFKIDLIVWKYKLDFFKDLLLYCLK